MPALGGRQPISYQFLPYSGRAVSADRFYSNEITALSIGGFLDDLGDLTAAIDAVTLGNISKTEWGEETIVSNTPASSKNAQAESSMLIKMRGATTEAPYSVRIPTIDFTKFNYAPAPNGDTVILSGAGASSETTALIAAIEALCKMPNDETEAVEVIGMFAER